MNKINVLLASFNGMQFLHAQIQSIAEQSNIQVSLFIADDGSTDGSTDLLLELFKGKAFTVLGDGVNRGPGSMFNLGFEWILANSSQQDIVVTLEADCTSDLRILPVMLTLNRTGYDLVLASVYAQGGGFGKTSFFRKFVSFGANFLFRFLFDVKVLTLSSFYRVYSVCLLVRIKEKYTSIITESGFVSMLEILVKAIRSEAKVIEVPMELHSSKRRGPSKMKILSTTLSYFLFLIKGTAKKNRLT